MGLFTKVISLMTFPISLSVLPASTYHRPFEKDEDKTSGPSQCPKSPNLEPLCEPQKNQHKTAWDDINLGKGNKHDLPALTSANCK